MSVNSGHCGWCGCHHQSHERWGWPHQQLDWKLHRGPQETLCMFQTNTSKFSLSYTLFIYRFASYLIVVYDSLKDPCQFAERSMSVCWKIHFSLRKDPCQSAERFLSVCWKIHFSLLKDLCQSVCVTLTSMSTSLHSLTFVFMLALSRCQIAGLSVLTC